MQIKWAERQHRNHSKTYHIASVKKHATPTTRIKVYEDNDDNNDTSNNTMSEEINAKDVDHVDTPADNDITTTPRRRSCRAAIKSKRVAIDENVSDKQLPSDHPQTQCISDAMEQDVALTHHADDTGEALTS